MNMDTGRLYESEAAALADGGKPESIVPVEVTGEIITVTSGPFKGRRYERLSNGQRGRRIKPDAEKVGHP